MVSCDKLALWWGISCVIIVTTLYEQARVLSPHHQPALVWWHGSFFGCPVRAKPTLVFSAGSWSAAAMLLLVLWSFVVGLCRLALAITPSGLVLPQSTLSQQHLSASHGTCLLHGFAALSCSLCWTSVYRAPTGVACCCAGLCCVVHAYSCQDAFHSTRWMLYSFAASLQFGSAVVVYGGRSLSIGKASA